MQDYWFKTIVNGTYMLIHYEGNDTDISIPDTYYGEQVTVIGDDIFKNHREIRSIAIPEGVKELGGFVFDGCASLEHVSLPDSLISIWQYAFVRSGIREITIPARVKNIVPFTFQDCINLEKIEILHPDVYISANACRNCPNLKQILYTDRITVSPDAFSASIPKLTKKET